MYVCGMYRVLLCVLFEMEVISRVISPNLTGILCVWAGDYLLIVMCNELTEVMLFWLQQLVMHYEEMKKKYSQC